MSVRIELAMPETVILSEIADKHMKREDVALTYALAMQSSEDVDWSKVNHAILDRWSLSGLKWIKTRAWKLVEAARKGEAVFPTGRADG